MQFLSQPMPLNNEVIDDRVATVLEAGTNVTLNYDDAANVLTINASPGGSGYTDEQAQDAVGTILQDSATIDYVYNDATPYITGLVKDNSITEAMLNLSDNTTKNSSTSTHGLLPKLPGGTTTFLRGDGTWVAPPTGTAYTDEQAQDAVAAMLTAGTNITLSYDDAANTLTINATVGTTYTNEEAQDAVGTILTDTSTIDFTYNDTTPSIIADVKDASITEAKLLLADNTTQDVSTTKHGLVPKLNGNATTFLNGSGGWTTPAGGGAAASSMGAIIRRTTTFGITASVLTVIPLNSEVQDDAGFWEGAINPSRLTIPVSGWYSITATLNWDTVVTTRIAYIRVDGVSLIAEQSSTGLADLRQTIAMNYYLSAGQYVEIAAFISSSSNLDTLTCSIASMSGSGLDTEGAQDAIGNILVDTTTIDFTYNDATPSIIADVKDASITEAKLLLADNTTQNVSTTKHGLVPKAPNVATQYLDGTGLWSTPAGGETGSRFLLIGV